MVVWILQFFDYSPSLLSRCDGTDLNSETCHINMAEKRENRSGHLEQGEVQNQVYASLDANEKCQDFEDSD